MLLKRLFLAVAFSATIGYASTLTIAFTGLPGVNENNTYNGFATATIDGVPNQLLICDDFSHTTYMPSEGLIYDFSTLSGPASLQNARFEASFGHPTATETRLYEEAAVLVWELIAAGPSASADTVTDYQYAIWNLFTPSTNLFRSNQTVLQQDAYNIVTGHTAAPAWLSTSYAEFTVFTPTTPFASNQEFLGMRATAQTQESSVPEPSMAWVMTVVGCLLAVVSRIRRRRV